MFTIKAELIEPTILKSESGRLYSIYNYKGQYDKYMNIVAYYMLEVGPNKFIVRHVVVPK